MPYQDFINAFPSIEDLDAAGFPKQTPDQRAKIDAVLFALWAQSHLERSRAASVLIILASWLVGGLFTLYKLPAALVRRLPEVVLAAIFTSLLSLALEAIGSLNVGAAFLLALILLLKSEILRVVRNFLFDIGDILSFSSLSRRYAKRHLAIGPLTILDDADGLKEHLFTSRLLANGSYSDEAEAFQKTVARKVVDWTELQSDLGEYWLRFPVEQQYWRDKQN